MPAAAVLVVLLSLCRPPPCSPCCSRCPHYRYAPLWPGSPECCPTVARAAAMLCKQHINTTLQATQCYRNTVSNIRLETNLENLGVSAEKKATTS
ncbi:hypothetical protein PF011_g32345, partial [Phytophthora fragariae]